MVNAAKNFLIMVMQQYATDTLKISSNWVIQKTAEATSDLVSNKTANKIIKVWRTILQNNLEIETVASETENARLDRKIPKERYLYPEKIQKL